MAQHLKPGGDPGAQEQAGEEQAAVLARRAWPWLVLGLLCCVALFWEALAGVGFVDASVALVGQDPLWPGVRAAYLPYDWSPTRIHQPWDAWSWSQWAQGRWPLWQPDEGLGHPLLANGQAAPLNPFKLLVGGALAGPAVAAFLVLRWLWGAVGAWVLARALALSPAGSALVAVGFAFQGAFIWHWQMAELHAWVMLPWLAWLAWRLLQEPGWGRAALWALALGFTALLGHAEGAVFAALGGVVLAWGLWWGEAPPAGRLIPALLTLALATVWGVAVSAGMVWPFLDLAAHSHSYMQGRADSALAGVDAAWPWWRMLFSMARHALGPSVWPEPWSFNAWATTTALVLAPAACWWGRRPVAVGAIFLAVVALLLLLVLPPVGLVPWPMPVPNAFYATPLLAMAVALGGGAALTAWDAGKVPPWGVAVPAALVATLAFGWSWGQSRLVAEGGPAALGGFGWAMALWLVLLAWRPQRWAPWVGLLVVLGAWGEGAWAMRALHGPKAGGYVSQHPALVALRELGHVRVAGSECLAPHLPVAVGLRSFTLMEAWMPPRLLAYWQAMGSHDGRVGTVLTLSPDFSRPLARLAGLAAVLCPKDSAMDRSLRARPEGFVVGGEAQGLVWHVAQSTTEAVVYHRWEQMPVGEVAAAKRLGQAPELWWSRALVEAPEGALGPMAPDGAATSPVQLLAQQATQGTWRVNLARPGLLVVAQQWDRDWVAWVDGRPQAIHPAQVAFRGLWLPAGPHEVVMRYDPPSVRQGLGLSAVASLLALWALAVGWWPWRRLSVRVEGADGGA